MEIREEGERERVRERERVCVSHHRIPSYAGQHMVSKRDHEQLAQPINLLAQVYSAPKFHNRVRKKGN